ncbi:N-formylglutamate amidohydrolase [Roseobacter sp. HKCCD9010]|uniref:N-formylglutamate amidohydrolase n=1 Tax=unclassified Roseobacter TaxID=196798 RepID=UPI001492A877|nr:MULTISPECIES: N-formylglutamate amidohydrolase [unclassified Roseobacter]MBF9048659.1 N-formylglutamate amidohydrolase [Rhodobacterales bacterium HKCCD4356]NNV10658.1 N-formylglutamate amidohydrolase [Roseobacter sp. HKCCD7357]NNV14843.1 N-formylglutamate amidohydrolase [Roseobacter sp. HKCCD8768]NNV24302.1 N-formylglutamate amidohydrolase [Roseobacter sp. HKCCD8192]NNV28559.1 N-formylglutamate amidohydrolase [Roseobacter sp. HKCCD9061]
MPRQAYRLDLPETVTTPVVAASPHSGRHYPWSFTRRTVLDERAIRSSEDAFMDMLVADAPALGAPLLVAEYPRAYVDLNRSSDELDPSVVAGLRRPSQNPRISSGLGVIPRVVANGRVIYRGKLTLEEAEARLSQVWHPYHEALDGLMRQAHDRFGRAVLLDFHSMPHEALDSMSRPGQRRPEVVLGDRFGASCDPFVVEEIEAAFEEAGLIVSRNAPFAGAFVTQHYGRPARGRHAVQIEIDRSLYMNEQLIRPNGNFENVKALIAEVLRRVIGPQAGQVPLAAE